MNRDVRRFRPSWRADARALRPELWLVALAAVAMLLTEVWQSSAMTEQSMALDAGKRALTQAEARLAWTEAQLDRQTTRRELAPLVAELGMVPADARQVVHVPAEYLSPAGRGRADEGPPSMLALAERASRAVVPEASARTRDNDR